jgi:hypothetical protein
MMWLKSGHSLSFNTEGGTSETIYRLLAEQAVQENRSLTQVAERLLAQELALATELENGQAVDSTAEDVVEALTAVECLTTLFADVEIDRLEQVLHEPMLELANADLDELVP